MISIANAFAHDGISVSMCVANDEGPRKIDLSPDIPITVLGKSRLIFALPRLIAHLRNVRPDVVYTTMTHANIIVSMAIFLSRVRSRLVVREAVSIEMLRSEVSPIAFYAWLTMARICYSRATCVVAVSHAIKIELEESVKVKPLSEVQVIYNAIDVNYQSLLQQEMVPYIDWLGKVPFVIGIGRFTSQKGFDVLIQAVGIVNTSLDYPIGLVLLGDGENRTQLVEAIEQAEIEFSFLPGYVENPMPFIRSAAAYVLTSRFEGLPNAMIQALACDTAIISTDCPTGPRELLEDGRWGSLVAVDDTQAVANEIEAVLRRSAQSCANMGKSDVLDDSDDEQQTESLRRFQFADMITQYKQCGQL